jgi:hypothetical protein
MDIASLIFDSTTSFTAALALFFSRLDIHHKRAAEPFDVYGALWNLAMETLDWSEWAANTDDIMHRWVKGELDDLQVAQALESTLSFQGEFYESVINLLRGTSDDGPNAAKAEAWQSLRHLLRVYGPEALEILEAAMEQRVAITRGLIAEIPNLRESGNDAMQWTVSRLKLATSELESAYAQMDRFMRENFPLSNWPRQH